MDGGGIAGSRGAVGEGRGAGTGPVEGAAQYKEMLAGVEMRAGGLARRRRRRRQAATRDEGGRQGAGEGGRGAAGWVRTAAAAAARVERASRAGGAGGRAGALLRLWSAARAGARGHASGTSGVRRAGGAGRTCGRGGTRRAGARESGRAGSGAREREGEEGGAVRCGTRARRTRCAVLCCAAVQLCTTLYGSVRLCTALCALSRARSMRRGSVHAAHVCAPHWPRRRAQVARLKRAAPRNLARASSFPCVTARPPRKPRKPRKPTVAPRRRERSRPRPYVVSPTPPTPPTRSDPVRSGPHADSR